MLSGLRSKLSNLLKERKVINMRELFSNHITVSHAYELYDLIQDLDHRVVYLNFDRIKVIDVTFFKVLRELSGENYSNIRYVKMPETFRRHI